MKEAPVVASCPRVLPLLHPPGGQHVRHPHVCALRGGDPQKPCLEAFLPLNNLQGPAHAASSTSEPFLPGALCQS